MGVAIRADQQPCTRSRRLAHELSHVVSDPLPARGAGERTMETDHRHRAGDASGTAWLQLGVQFPNQNRAGIPGPRGRRPRSAF